MTKKIVLDQFHYHEALDRACLIAVMWEREVARHAVTRKHRELRELAHKAAEAMWDYYQAVPDLTSNQEKEKS